MVNEDNNKQNSELTQVQKQEQPQIKAVFNNEHFDLNILLDKKNLILYFLFVVAFLYCSYFFEVPINGLVVILMLTLYLLFKHWLYLKGYKGNNLLLYIMLVVLLTALFFVGPWFFLIFLVCIIAAIIMSIKNKDRTNLIVIAFMNLISITFAIAITLLAYTFFVFVLLFPFVGLSLYLIILLSFPFIFLFFFLICYFINITSINKIDTEIKSNYKQIIKITTAFSIIVLFLIVILYLIIGISITKKLIDKYDSSNSEAVMKDYMDFQYITLLLAKNNFSESSQVLKIIVKTDGTIISPGFSIDNTEYKSINEYTGLVYYNCNPATLKCQNTRINQDEPIGKLIGFDNLKDKVNSSIIITKDENGEVCILSIPYISNEYFANLPLSPYTELEKTNIAKKAKEQKNKYILFDYNIFNLPVKNNLKELAIYSFKERITEDFSKYILVRIKLDYIISEWYNFYNSYVIIKEWEEIENNTVYGSPFSDGTTTLNEHISRLDKEIASIDHLYTENKKEIERIRTNSNHISMPSLSSSLGSPYLPGLYFSSVLTLSHLTNQLLRHTKYWSDLTKLENNLKVLSDSRYQEEEQTRIQMLNEIKLETDPKEKAIRLKLLEKYYIFEFKFNRIIYLNWVCNQENKEYYCRLFYSNEYDSNEHNINGCINDCPAS